jgi:hypothetical protein
MPIVLYVVIDTKRTICTPVGIVGKTIVIGVYVKLWAMDHLGNVANVAVKLIDQT